MKYVVQLRDGKDELVKELFFKGYHQALQLAGTWKRNYPGHKVSLNQLFGGR